VGGCYVVVVVVVVFLGGDDSSWEEVKVAIGKHSLGKVVNQGLCLDEEVVEHCVRFPPSKEVDDVRVNVGTEEHHGTACLEGVGKNVTRAESHSVAHNGCHLVEGIGDVF